MYSNPVLRVIGEGAFDRIKQIVLDIKPVRTLLVLGRRSFRESPHSNKLKNFLLISETEECPAVPSNPTVLFLENVFERIRAKKFDLVIAAGGGSALDTGKTLAAALAQGDPGIGEYFSGKKSFTKNPVPCIAVPTTSGTGSEVTPFASFETADRQKVSLEARQLYSAYAVVDPLLCLSMPPYVTAATGMDALCQGIESYWAKRINPFAETHALRAVALVLRSLKTAVREPANLAARSDMALASTEAGLAIAQTRTTAVHAASYPMTSFFGAAHGHACAVTLAPFIRFNAPAMDPGRAALLWKTMEVPDSEAAAVKIERLMDEIGLKRSLSAFGIDRRGIEVILDNGFRADRVSNNPRLLTRADLAKILESVY